VNSPRREVSRKISFQPSIAPQPEWVVLQPRSLKVGQRAPSRCLRGSRRSHLQSNFCPPKLILALDLLLPAPALRGSTLRYKKRVPSCVRPILPHRQASQSIFSNSSAIRQSHLRRCVERKRFASRNSRKVVELSRRRATQTLPVNVSGGVFSHQRQLLRFHFPRYRDSCHRLRRIRSSKSYVAHGHYTADNLSFQQTSNGLQILEIEFAENQQQGTTAQDSAISTSLAAFPGSLAADPSAPRPLVVQIIVKYAFTSFARKRFLRFASVSERCLPRRFQTLFRNLQHSTPSVRKTLQRFPAPLASRKRP